MTRELRDRLREQRVVVLESWAHGAYTHASAEGTAQANAKAIGAVEVYESVIQFIEDLMEPQA